MPNLGNEGYGYEVPKFRHQHLVAPIKAVVRSILQNTSTERRNEHIYKASK